MENFQLVQVPWPAIIGSQNKDCEGNVSRVEGICDKTQTWRDDEHPNMR